MSTFNKTGGGKGTNQYKIRGQAKATSNAEHQTETACGYPADQVVELGDCVWLRGEFDDTWCLKHRQLAPELRQLMNLAPCPWRNAGFEDPVKAAQWQGARFSPEEAKRWHDAGWEHPEEAAQWQDTGLSPREAKGWNNAKFGPNNVRFGPEEAKEWIGAGVWDPEEVNEWIEAGFDPEGIKMEYGGQAPWPR